MQHGRTLEKELFRFHFEKAPATEVISILKYYQGADGGFYNMGEGDAEVSNAMDTTMAFQIISDIGASSSEEIVQKGIKYIMDSYDQKLQCWHPKPTERISNWLDNPGAELVGYLYEYNELVPNDFLNMVSKHAIASMSTIQTTKESKQFYFLSALCILRMAIRINEPNKSFIIKQLENEINSQSANGNFTLNWNADGESARVWQSIWTMDVLKTLNNHCMIEQE